MKTNKLKQQKGTLLRVLQYVKPYRVLVIVSLLCACVSAAAQLLIPILTRKAIDQMIGAGQVNLSGVLVFAVWIGRRCGAVRGCPAVSCHQQQQDCLQHQP